jgi:hypothetical protein
MIGLIASKVRRYCLITINNFWGVLYCFNHYFVGSQNLTRIYGRLTLNDLYFLLRNKWSFKATAFEANYLNLIKHKLLQVDYKKDLRLMKIYRSLVPIETDELLK